MRAPTNSALNARARTDWRRLGAWTLLVLATSAALALGVRSEQRTRVIEHRIDRRGEPCVALPNGLPSHGCQRLAQLLARTCVLNPRLCAAAFRGLSPDERQALRKALIDRAAARARRDALRRKRRAAKRQRARARAPVGGAPAPGRGGDRGAAPAAGGGSSSSPAPAGTPTTTDAVNETKDVVRGSGNDLLERLGVGRPVPELPDVCPPAVLPPCS
jgi:hypothetical protein